MAKLDMNTATYARNTDRKAVLESKINDEFSKYKKSLKEDNYLYQQLAATREQYWVGPDSDAFWQVLNQRIENVKASCDRARNRILQIIEDDYSRFYNMQNNNANNIKNSR